MVQWKGDVTEEAGKKARRLDGLESFNVPNFFVVTPDEIKQLFNGKETSEEILNSSIDQRKQEEIKDAYQDVGMSSEVRKASGKARNLVGGQRNSQFVSVRISNSGKEEYNYKLNVGSSNFFDALREVVASYCEKERGHPSVIVQKMVEPGYTATLELHGGKTIIETVQGLGISLEEGLTVPLTYIVSRGNLEHVFTPDEQLEIRRNPVHGDNQRRKITVDEEPFKASEIESIARKASRKNVNLKFVYKRGSFHVVDAYESKDQSPAIEQHGLRACKGEINGRVGSQVAFTDQTLAPDEFREALICTKGGYTSRDGYRVRKAGKPAVFRFEGELENGQRVSMDAEQVLIKSSVDKTAESTEKSVNPFKQEADHEESSLASEILPVDPRVGRGVCINRSSDQGYVLTDRATEATRIPESGYIADYKDFFSFEGEKALIDARKLELEELGEALKYLDADLKILVVSRPSRELIRPAVEAGVTVFGIEDSIESFENLLASEEKRFIMNRLRELE